MKSWRTRWSSRWMSWRDRAWGTRARGRQVVRTVVRTTAHGVVWDARRREVDNRRRQVSYILSNPLDAVHWIANGFQIVGTQDTVKKTALSPQPLWHSGRVPPQLLSNLHYLDISRADYLNSTDISWLLNLPLRYLSMESVDLSSVADWAHVVNMIPSLKVLRLADCSLTSANQSLMHLNLTNLETLHLYGNYMDHAVASCWFWADFFIWSNSWCTGEYDVPWSPWF
jgi:hypothetical protein